MARLGLFAMLVSVGALVGCEAVIVNGETGEGGAATGGAGGGNTSSNPNPSGPGPDPLPANGYAEADGYGYSVRVGNFAMSCGDTTMPACSSTAHYGLSFRLDDDDVFVGSQIPLRWETTTMDLVDADTGNGCGLGFATFNGLVEITGVDADSIQMLVSYGQGEGLARLDRVPFDVPICGTEGPQSAIAMTHYEFVNGGPGTTTNVSVNATGGNFHTVAVSSVAPSTGTALDYDALHLFVGNRPPACEYPWAGDCSEPYWKVDVLVPPYMQHVGTYSLSGLASYTEADTCYNAGGGGTFWGGTIQILAIDDYEVTFTLAGTNPFFLTGGSADGTYTAPRCW